MIRIGRDYNDFSARYASFLEQIFPQGTLVVDIVPHSKAPFINTDNTPFACNPSISFGSKVVITYNETIIGKAQLTISEQDACLFHELGHYVFNGIYDDDELEFYCDNIAISAGLSLTMATSLCKLRFYLKLDSLNNRIDAVRKQCNIYRPEWTCGRYNKEHHAAIFYNLIEGMSYYFEGQGADVIGMILAAGRNKPISSIDFFEIPDLDELCLHEFLITLLEKRLICTDIWDKFQIYEYRAETKEQKGDDDFSKLSSPYVDPNMSELDSSEMDYTYRVNGVMSVMFELTYNCSEQCIHCYNVGAAHTDNEESRRGERIELELDDYKRVIDELVELGMFRACLTGGDPFSKPIVWDIMNYLYEKDVAFDVYTNGQRLLGNEERLAMLYPKLVGISIYSGIPEIHDKITRVKGSYERSIKVLGRLCELSIPLYLKCCVIKSNFDSYQTVYSLAAEFNAVPQIEVNVKDSIEGNTFVSKHLRLSPEQYESILQDNHVSLYVGEDVLDIIGQPKPLSSSACRAGQHTFNITPEGNLIPCCAFHLVLGNVREKTIKEIISDNETLIWWKNLKLEQYEECGKHEYCSFCNLCPGMNYSEHGTPLMASENNCYIAKIRCNLAKKIRQRKEILDS